MAKQFGRYNRDSETFDLSEYNRLIEAVSSRTASNWVGTPSQEDALGFGILPRPDLFQFLMIRPTSVTTTATAAVPVVPAYDWQEVVLKDGLYQPPGDGRSGTADIFPAYEVSGSANVTLNTGALNRAHLAWLSWDQKSIEFIGAEVSTSSSGGGGGAGSGFVGALVKSITFIDPFTTGQLLTFDTVKYDTSGFFNPLAPTRLTIPVGISGYFVYGTTFDVGPVTADDSAYSRIALSNSLGVDKGNYDSGQGFNIKASTIAGPGGDAPARISYTSSPCQMESGDYGVVNLVHYLILAGPIVGERSFWCYAVGT